MSLVGFRYCKHGDNKRIGGVNGRDCKYFDPMICKDSLTKRECLNKDCTFDHLKLTRRKQESARKENPAPQIQGNKTEWKSQLDSIVSLTTPYPPTGKQTYTNVVRQGQAQPNAVEEPSYFLLQLLENMKEGIICQVADRISELQASLPSMVQDQIRQ